MQLVSGAAAIEGQVGDGSHVARDVDLYRIQLAAGQLLTADVLARRLPTSSTLDSVVRLFNAAGTEILRNDDFGGTTDSRITFLADTTGSYFIGVSGYGNSRYSPTVAGSGRSGSQGVYRLSVTVAGSASASGPAGGFLPGRLSLQGQPVPLRGVAVSGLRAGSGLVQPTTTQLAFALGPLAGAGSPTVVTFPLAAGSPSRQVLGPVVLRIAPPRR